MLIYNNLYFITSLHFIQVNGRYFKIFNYKMFQKLIDDNQKTNIPGKTLSNLNIFLIFKI